MKAIRKSGKDVKKVRNINMANALGISQGHFTYMQGADGGLNGFIRR